MSKILPSWRADELLKVAARAEKKLREQGTGSSKSLVVKKSGHDEDGKAVLEDAIKLDDLPHKKGGFKDVNKLGRQALTELWNKDNYGFYVLYDHKQKPMKPIGYFDLFGLAARDNFIKKKLQNTEPGELDLPDTEELCKYIIPRDRWDRQEIEIYVDAIICPYRDKYPWGVAELLRAVCQDLLRYNKVRVTKIATVVVENTNPELFKAETANNPIETLVLGAKAAMWPGMDWGVVKNTVGRTYRGYGRNKDCGRYLYFREFGLVHHLGPVTAKALALATTAGLGIKVLALLEDAVQRQEELEKVIALIKHGMNY